MVEDMRFYKEIDLQDSPIGKIPKDWKATKMGDVAHVKGRIGWRGLKASEYTTEGPYLIANKHLANNKIIWDKCDHLSEFRYTESSEIQLQINDVIISKDGTIGQPAFIDSLPDRATINSTMMLLRVKNDVLAPEFLFYFLQGPHFKRFLKQKISGTSIPHLFQRDMKELDFFIPSLAEQRGVVGVLGVVDSAIELVDRVIWKTERLKKGLMQELLTKGIGHTEYKDTPIGKTPIEWKLEKIRDVCEVVTGGTPSTKHPEYFGGNIKWLKSGDIKQLYIYDTTEKITQLGIENSNAKIHPTDSVAIALSGRGQTRGRTTIIKVPMACSQSVAFMIPSSEIVAEYLHYNLSNRYMEIRNLTGHLDRSGLNLSIVSEIQIPVPSLTEQQKIVSILVTADNKLDLERKEKDKLERLKRGLMGLLLTGKVRIKVD